jgi:hypothetical protein
VASLHLVPRSGDAIPVPLPDPSVAAVAPIDGDRLLALLRDGRAFVARRGPTGLAAGAGWLAVALDGPGAMPPGAFIWSATASSDGRLVAAIARPADAQSPGALVLIEPDQGRREVHLLEHETEGNPPAWVDDARVAIVERDRYDRVFLELVAVADMRILERLTVRAVGFATSGDGATCAALPDDRVVVGSTASLLALGMLPESGPALPAEDHASGGIALSAGGRYVALSVRAGDTGPGWLAVYERIGGGWEPRERLSLPAGVSGGQPTWLP